VVDVEHLPVEHQGGHRLHARPFQRFGVIERRSFPEIPPRVEYSLTAFGEKFVKVLDEIEALENELAEREA
jgi:DNA-binding HxlR family transcriptional regulator